MEILADNPVKHPISRAISNLSKLTFGSYFVFQEYSQAGHDGKQYRYHVSKPILALYVGCLPCDQTVELMYLPWYNEQNTYRRQSYEYPKLGSHIEWSDYANILAIWDHKPTWREILAAYRKQLPTGLVYSDAIEWDED